MHIHKKGLPIIAIATVVCVALVLLAYKLLPTKSPFFWIVAVICASMLFWTLSFFRVPHRTLKAKTNELYSSADGTVVVIEKVDEPEYFKDERLQISVFMSPFNVHVNWFPFNAKVVYMKYHPGEFLFANHPKSSTLNERNSIVFQDEQGREVLVRQIAGIMARRIVSFTSEGEVGNAGDEFGLIRFGSRVDFFLPIDSEIQVQLGEKVKGKQTLLAYLK